MTRYQEHTIEIPTRPTGVTDADLNLHLERIRRARHDLVIYRGKGWETPPWTESGPAYYDNKTTITFTRYA